MGTWGITHSARCAGLRAGAVVTNWKGKGISHPPSQTPAVEVFLPSAALQVCEALGNSPSVEPGALQPHTPVAATAVGSSPWLMSPLSPVTTLPLMSPLLLEALGAGEAAAPGAADKGFHSPAVWGVWELNPPGRLGSS